MIIILRHTVAESISGWFWSWSLKFSSLWSMMVKMEKCWRRKPCDAEIGANVTSTHGIKDKGGSAHRSCWNSISVLVSQNCLSSKGRQFFYGEKSRIFRFSSLKIPCIVNLFWCGRWLLYSGRPLVSTLFVAEGSLAPHKSGSPQKYFWFF